eukprot:6177639-Pleurochrysis_carterae.AAC.1
MRAAAPSAPPTKTARAARTDSGDDAHELASEDKARRCGRAVDIGRSRLFRAPALSKLLAQADQRAKLAKSVRGGCEGESETLQVALTLACALIGSSSEACAHGRVVLRRAEACWQRLSQ